MTSSEAVFEVAKEDYANTVWLDAPVKGDASETALVKFFQPIEDIELTRSNNKVVINKDNNPVKMPFNSTNKYALTIIEAPKDKSHYCIYIKGAPEKVWLYCKTLLVDG
jgi:sodium/potassium-transporting ATPase subunit alpha